MNIKYEFVTGEVVEIEVENAVGEISIEIERDINNNNRRETRRHNSIEDMQLQGTQIADGKSTVTTFIEIQERNKALYFALDKLLPQQKKLIYKVFFEGKSIIEIALAEGVSEAAIRNRLNKIYKKLKNIIN